jgi:hypothetical protein
MADLIILTNFCSSVLVSIDLHLSNTSAEIYPVFLILTKLTLNYIKHPRKHYRLCLLVYVEVRKVVGFFQLDNASKFVSARHHFLIPLHTSLLLSSTHP